MRKSLGVCAFIAAALASGGAQAGRYVQYTFYALVSGYFHNSTVGPYFIPASEDILTLTLDTTDLSGVVGDYYQQAHYTISDSGIMVGTNDRGHFFSNFAVTFAPGTFNFDPTGSIGFTRDDFLSSTYSSQSTYYHGEFNASGSIGALAILVSDTPFAEPIGYAETGPFAVPEPATWATMIAGFGLVGGALRRRSSSRAVLA